MIYVTTPLMPVYHQMTIEELLFATETRPGVVRRNKGSTKTYTLDYLPFQRMNGGKAWELIRSLERFNAKYTALREAPDRHDLYEVFFIPKKTRGMRKICAPKPELMNALRELKTIFEEEFHALYHTSAFAYVKGRSTVDAVKKHQLNASRWFGHFDLHDFFGSTTKDFVMRMFEQIFPFCMIMTNPYGKEMLSTALDLAFLDGGLPQGTPISPLITNVMMIPFDFCLTKQLRGFEGQNYVYTRYADDFIISSRYDFDVQKIQNLIISELQKQGAPFTLNVSKTHYGSSSGRNWNLGVMLNAENKITIGYKKKKNFISMLRNFVLSARSENQWTVEEVQYALGLYSYYRMVEGDDIDAVVKKIDEKYHSDVIAEMRKVIS